jgi:hypothetical protein
VNKVPGGQTKAPDRPDAKGIEGAVRQALKEYIEKVLFNAANPAGDAFRASVLEGRSDGEREAAKKEMLSQASRWISRARGWEKNVDGDKTVYSGRLYQLHTDVTLDKTGKPLEVRVELD